MSYLPYTTGSIANWFTASGSSGLVHAGIIAMALNGLPDWLYSQDEIEEDEPEFNVTIEQLDADTLTELLDLDTATLAPPEETEAEALDDIEGEQLAALAPELLEPETEAQAPEELTPETPDEAEAEELVAEEPEELVAEEAEALEAETAEAIEPELEAESLEGMEPETLEAGVTETIDALEPLPEVPNAVEAAIDETVVPLPDPEQLEQVQPEVASGRVIADETVGLAPLEPEETSAAPAAVASVSPLAPDPDANVVKVLVDDNAQPAPVTPAPVLPQISGQQTQVLASVGAGASDRSITPTAPAAETVVAAARPALPETPAPRAQPEAKPPSAQDIALIDLIRRIRTSPAPECLIALPRRDGEEGVGLSLVAGSEGAINEFVDSVLTQPADLDIVQTRTLVDERQCPALAYLRSNTDYPATRLAIRMDSELVPSGGRMTGLLRGHGARYPMLLMIDNNGVVQDLGRFMTFSGGLARFDVPVTRVGPVRDTAQIVLALATSRPPNLLRERDGQLARDVFAGLEGELASGAALSLVTLDVR